MAYTQRILETGTTFLPEDDGVFMIADFTGSQRDDLVFIKTANTGTNSVEVHVASAASNYQTRIYEKGTTFRNEDDGTWLMIPSANGGRPDLCFIKTRNTPLNKVEVHIASGASDYQQRILETATTFANETDGVWSMCDFTGKGQQDLVFIKTSNTGTNSVEVHVASAASNYQTRIQEVGTTFREETDGAWILRPWSKGAGQTLDLVFIKTANTGTNRVEVHVAQGPTYQTRVLEVGTTFMPETDGVWTMSASKAAHPDLIFIKTGPTTGTGTVEMHIASA